MITIRTLNRETAKSLMSDCPRIFQAVSENGPETVIAILDDNAIIKTTGDRDHVTIDLAGHLFEIMKSDMVDIVIT